MKHYEITKGINTTWHVYEVTEYSYELIKVFKTLKGAQNWVAKHS